MRPSVKKLLLFGTTAPYADAMLALDFVGSRSAGTPYYMLNGVRYPTVTAVPGWTYTGGTPAGIGSYAPRLDGSLQFFPSYTNLLLQSQTLNVTWGTNATTVSANTTTAPDGTLTADSMLETATTAQHSVVQNVAKPGAAAMVLTFSGYVKQFGQTRNLKLTMTDGSGNGCDFIINTATLATVSGPSYYGASPYSGGSIVATNEANGFIRFAMTATTSSGASNQVYIQTAQGTTLSFLGDTSTGFYIWGAQLELGSTASTYIPTTTAAVTVAPPRITGAGYLAEEARTNSIRNNTMVGAVVGTPGTLPTNWSWSGSGTITASVVGFGTGAYGPYIDVRLAGTPTAVSNSVLWYEISNNIAAVNAQVWSPSAYLSMTAGTLNNVSGITPRTELRNSSNGFLTSGTSGSAVVPTATPAQLTGPYTISNASTAFIRPGLSLFHADTSAVDVTLRIAVPQLELGSFATSPIPTTSVAVTRAADVGYISGLTVPSAWTLLESHVAQGALVNLNVAAELNDGSTNNRAFTAQNGSASIFSNSIVGGSGGAGAAITVPTSGNVSAAITTSGSNLLFAASGSAVSTAATSLPANTSLTRLYVGNRSDAVRPFGNSIRRIVIYPRAMSNAELQAITTAGAY